MRHSTSKRLEPYRTCLRCQQEFENTSDNFYLQKSAGPDKMGIIATYPRCKKCHCAHVKEVQDRVLERKKRETIMKYGFDNNYKTYDQLQAKIGHKEEPYYKTEDEMEYKAPSLNEILYEYRYENIQNR